MSRFSVEISPDGMEAILNLEEAAADWGEVRNALHEHHITYGLDENALRDQIRSAGQGSKIPLARGKRPLPGEDARLVYLVDFKNMEMEGENSIKRVDFKKIKDHVFVEKDQDLVAKLPCSEGAEGIDVRGNKIYARGKDIELPAGKNTYVSDDGLTLRSRISGYLTIIDKKITVDSTYTIKGNVDFSTGNVNYQGDVVIEGDVRSGFKVYASGDITVKGNVDAADVFSKEGTITVLNGILGKNKAKLLAGNDIICGFVQDASLGAKQNIVIKRYAFNSSLSAGKSIKAVDGEGLIRGGTAVADQSIEVTIAGSLQNKQTELRISDSDYYEQELHDLEQKRSRTDLEAELSVARKRVDFLTLLEQRLGKLSHDKQLELKGIINKVEDLERKIETYVAAGPAPETKENADKDKRSIIVRDKCHRGVILQIGDAQKLVEDTLVGMIVKRNDDKLQIKPLRPGE